MQTIKALSLYYSFFNVINLLIVQIFDLFYADYNQEGRKDFTIQHVN